MKKLLLILALSLLVFVGKAQTTTRLVVTAASGYCSIDNTISNGSRNNSDYPLNAVIFRYNLNNTVTIKSASNLTDIVTNVPYTLAFPGNAPSVHFADSTAFKAYIRAGFFVGASDTTGIYNAIALKADKTTTVNGHALNANVTVTKGDVNLGSADNTSDINKPVSTAQATALAAKEPLQSGLGYVKKASTTTTYVASIPTADLADVNKINGGASSYLGHVGTRCGLPNNSAGASLTWLMSKSAHWARDKIVNPTLVFANYKISSTNVEQTTGAGTIKVSIEYPAGTFTLANENIAASGPVTFAIGNTSLTFNITIPKNVKFWVRSLQNTPAGAVWSQYQSAYACDQSEGFENGTGTPTDKTTSGTVAAGGNVVFSPVVIAAQTVQPSLVILGDSRECGGTEGITTLDGNVGLTARTVGRVYGCSSFAISGTTLAQWNAASRTYRDALFQYFSAVSVETGVNDIGAGGVSAATLAASRATCATNLLAANPNITVIGHTLPPYTSSTDNFQTTTNQASQGTNETRILQFNDLERAGIAGESFCWDLADAIDPYRLGVWPAQRNKAATALTNTWTATGSISATALTVTAVTGTPIKINDPIVGTGVQPSTTIKAQVSGTTGGVGVYTVDRAYSGYPYPSPVASTTISTGGYSTNDGLHPTAAISEDIPFTSKINLNDLRRSR